MKSNDPVLGSKNGEILCRFTSATYERTKNYVPIVNKSSLRGKIPRCIMNSVKIQLALKDTKRGGHRPRKRRHFSVLPEIRSETTGLDFLTGRNLFQEFFLIALHFSRNSSIGTTSDQIFKDPDCGIKFLQLLHTPSGCCHSFLFLQDVLIFTLSLSPKPRVNLINWIF